MSGCESDSDTDSDIDIEETAVKELSLLLPEKSKEKYQKVYDNFKKWCGDKKVDTISEKVLVAYFSTEIKDFKASTSWSIYSMLRITLILNDNLNISIFNNLKALLKLKADGYNAKKSKTFTKEEFYRFIKEAPDEYFLALKVILIIGVYGACRRDELTKMKLEEVEFVENGIKITLPFNTKTKISRQFLIDEGEDSDVNLIEIVKNYVQLRPADVPSSRFFINYRNGKCKRQPIGINTIGGCPHKIATFLKLPTPNEFTGHCFRRTSAALLKNLAILPNRYLLHYEKGLAKPPSVNYTISSVSAASNHPNDYDYTNENGIGNVNRNMNDNINEHLCTISCGQVKCAMSENEKSSLHAFNLMKPPDYTIADVMPALFASDPTCRWIVAYIHNTGPVSSFNTDETFKRITRSIPNNVRIVQKYIRMETSQFVAAYVVEYGVNCTCQDDSSEVFTEMSEIKCEF